MTKINTQSGVKSLKPLWSSDDPALILFTSGTTGKPKGVVHTFNSLFHQLSDIQESWEMRKDDRFFVSLPLNHIHGLVTVICFILYSIQFLHVHKSLGFIKWFMGWCGDCTSFKFRPRNGVVCLG